MARKRKPRAATPVAVAAPRSSTFAAWFTATNADSVEAHIDANGITNGESVTVTGTGDAPAWPAGTFTWNGIDLPAGSIAADWDTASDWSEVIEPTDPSWPVTTPPAWPSVVDAPVPPSAPGEEQPEFASGSATAPAPPITITGSPIIPPPPIGDPVGVPTFPPPTPPPIGVVPIGPLVGPAISPAPVPPSLAGVTQPQFDTGSATSPASYFPDFTAPPFYYPGTTPAGPANINNAIWTNPSLAGGVWTVPPLPTTPGTFPLTMVTTGGPPFPPSSWVNPPGAGLV